ARLGDARLRRGEPRRRGRAPARGERGAARARERRCPGTDLRHAPVHALVGAPPLLLKPASTGSAITLGVSLNAAAGRGPHGLSGSKGASPSAWRVNTRVFAGPACVRE